MSDHGINTIRQLLTEYTEGERQGLECWQVSRRYLPTILNELEAARKLLAAIDTFRLNGTEANKRAFCAAQDEYVNATETT